MPEMKCQDTNPKSLFHALEAEGWVWDDERLYAPTRFFWIEGTRGQSIPFGMLVMMGERMKVTLASLRANKPAHLSTEQYHHFVGDMESLANTIEELLSNKTSQ
jgi:hypothetical protein